MKKQQLATVSNKKKKTSWNCYSLKTYTTFRGSRQDGKWITTWWDKEISRSAQKIQMPRKKDNFFNSDEVICTTLDLHLSDTVWVVWAIYSVGDKSSRDYNRFHSYLALFKMGDFSSAQQLKDALEKRADDKMYSAYTITTKDGQRITIEPHWCQHFAGQLEEIRIDKIDVHTY